MRPEARRGFTLVELLLTVGLLLLLAGAVIFSFSSLQRGAGLEEGATRLEALLRFARAHAAGTGRQVQIRFEEDVGEGLLVPLGRLRVVWEPDPLLQPGFFEELPEANVYVKGITELVSIEEVRPWPRDESPASSSALAPARGQDEGVEAPGEFAPMLFYPDGSADSTEIVLAALDGEDPGVWPCGSWG